MFQNEVKEIRRLLDKEGNISEAGFAKKLNWEYNRADITARPCRIKEWDYYYIGNDECALCLTMADMGYIGALSATVMDFTEPSQITKSAVCFFPMGSFRMPYTSIAGDCSRKIGKVEMTFINDGFTRRLYGKYPKFGNAGETLSFNVTLTDFPEESMVIATPFEKKGYFYYNQKINCMTADGGFSLGDKEYSLAKEKKTLATLDWGRGVWTYDNTWYWGSLQTVLPDGKKFGFNIGYGFGCNDQATENMLFYGGKSHKIDEVTFHIPQKDGKDDFMSPWEFTSSDGRFEMQFEPLIDRYAPFDLKLFAMIPHQVFGYFTGKAVLDDGQTIELTRTLGFAEKVRNKW